jgi:hypothetical protein
MGETRVNVEKAHVDIDVDGGADDVDVDAGWR